MFSFVWLAVVVLQEVCLAAVPTDLSGSKRKHETMESVSTRTADLTSTVVLHLATDPDASVSDIYGSILRAGVVKADLSSVARRWHEYRPFFVVPTWFHVGLVSGDWTVIERFDKEFIRYAFKVSAKEIASSWKSLCIDAVNIACFPHSSGETWILHEVQRKLFALSVQPVPVLSPTESLMLTKCNFAIGLILTHHFRMRTEMVISALKRHRPRCTMEPYQVEMMRLNLRFLLAIPEDIYREIEAAKLEGAIDATARLEAANVQLRTSLKGVHILSPAFKLGWALWQSTCTGTVVCVPVDSYMTVPLETGSKMLERIIAILTPLV